MRLRRCPRVAVSLALAGVVGGASPQARAAPASGPPADTPDEAPRPPRVDGWYLGAIAFGSLGWARVNGLETPDALAGGGGGARIGQVVLPWLSVGVQLLGNLGYASPAGNRQRFGSGGLMVDLAVYPVPRRPFTIRGSLGFGGGAVREAGTPGRSGMGGAIFGLAVGYPFFPLAGRMRPNRGGGWSIGPELGYLALPPAVRGRPMANTLYLAISTTMYFGS